MVLCSKRLIARGLSGPVPPTGFRGNGCGSGWSAWLVPDCWFGEACRWHDYHYELIARRQRLGRISAVRAYRWRRQADYRLWRNIVYLSGARVDVRRQYVYLDYWRPRAWAGVVIGAAYCVAVRFFGVRNAR